MQNSMTRFQLWHLSIFGFVIICSLMVWGLNKGFDMTDEAFYVLSYQHPEITMRGNTFFQTAMPKLVGAGASIIDLRAAKLFINLALAVLLAFSLQQFANRRQIKDFVVYFSFAFIGLYFGATWLPQTPSYNDFSNWGLALCVAGLLLSCAAIDASKILQYLGGGLLIGVGSIVFAIAKIPAFLALTGFLLLCLILSVWLKINKLKLYKITMGYFCGLVVGVFGFHLFVMPMGEAYQLFQMAFQATSSRELYQPNTLIFRYIKLATEFFMKLGLLTLPLWLFFKPDIFKGRFNGRLTEENIKILSYVGAIIAVIVLRKNHAYLPRGISNMPTMVYNLLLITALMILPHICKFDRRKFLTFVAIVLIMPILGAFGTANNLVYQSTVHIFPIFLIFAMQLNQQTEALSKKVLILISIFYLFIGLHFYFGYLQKPYRHLAPLWQQTVDSDEIGLKLDIETANFYKQLTQIKDKYFAQNKEGLFFSGGAGAIYALKMKSRGEPWYFVREPMKTCRAIERGSLDSTVKDQWPVVFVDHELSSTIIECLRSMLGIELHKNYQEVAVVKNPYPDRDSVHIFIKKN
jgi:hypothetical protein